MCRETKDSFLVAVPDRTALTLTRELRWHVAKGSMVYSDCWKGYSTAQLKNAGYTHKYHFVDPTQASYLVEFMWRRKHRNEPDTVPSLVEAIALQWPPQR